ncbi:hypothetical protein DFH08DRAFT_887863 [Mycena albidolilacea]|uniref:Uncharacterized protein n=1 Tax=Mycena albidolilacea TaxID=1033008 RepID=A0AAD6ZI69_9AGAR|nr:hypothetical protein DFH08DRAFT_887863 [Mycena albidolilacea]
MRPLLMSCLWYAPLPMLTLPSPRASVLHPGVPCHPHSSPCEPRPLSGPTKAASSSSQACRLVRLVRYSSPS